MSKIETIALVCKQCGIVHSNTELEKHGGCPRTSYHSWDYTIEMCDGRTFTGRTRALWVTMALCCAIEDINKRELMSYKPYAVTLWHIAEGD
jgi:hypothetical protein